MNLIQTLNDWSELWAGFMWSRSVEALTTFVVIFIIWYALRKRISPQLGYGLFLLVFVKILLPFQFTSPAHVQVGIAQTPMDQVMYWNEPPWRAPFDERLNAGALGHLSHVSSDHIPQSKTDNASLPANVSRFPSMFSLIMIGWGAIVLGLLFHFLWRQRKFSILTQHAQNLPSHQLNVDFAELKIALNIHKFIPIKTHDAITAPVVYGFFHPVLLLPPDFCQTYTPAQMQWILLHELAHIRRFDTLAAALQKIVQILFFFHPVIWLTNWILDQQREYACDDMALLVSKASRIECSKGFLSLVQRMNHLPVTPPTATTLGLLNYHTQIRRRMMRILDTNHKLHIGLTVGSIAFLTFVALLILPSVRAEDKQAHENVTPAQKETEGSISAKSLHEAAAEGDLELVKELISKGADVNAKDEWGYTPLRLAANNGHLDVAELLISKIADINTSVTKQGTTVLHTAASRGHIDLVKLLIDNGADVNVQRDNGYTPLQHACFGGHLNVIELLLDNGADLELGNMWGQRPLHVAAYYNKPEVIEFLLEKGANIEAGTRPGGTALIIAIEKGHQDAVEVLLSHGADIHTRKHGTTPVNMAMYYGQSEMIRFLMDKGAEYSDIHVAAYFGEYDKVMDYLTSGGDINKQNLSGQTLIHSAICGKQNKLIQTLISKGADLNRKSSFGWSPLHMASALERTEIVELLLDNGVNVNSKDKDNRTPLHWAAMKGNKEIVENLVAKGGDVNAKSDSVEEQGKTDGQWTPLHQACTSGNKEVVEILLANGADINAKTKLGKTPLMAAKFEYEFQNDDKFKEIMDLLQEHGAK